MFNATQPSYESFRRIIAERTTPLVAWVGAGVSASAGLPDWQRLQDGLRDALRRKIAELDPSDRTRAEDQLRGCERARDPWVGFSMLKEALGPASFRAQIREALGRAGSAPIPAAYTHLWRLRPHGLITLNLDRLATRAYSGAFPGKPLHEISGMAVARMAHVLKSSDPFVANLHGIEADESTWVLTMEDLKALHDMRGFREFITTVFGMATVAFIGITADDVAAGALLARLTERGIDTGQHFWITHRRDSSTDEWAERSGLQVIRYAAIEENHQELHELFDDLSRFVSTDATPPPVRPNVEAAVEPLLPLADLLKLETEDELRVHLNRHAARLLKPGTEDAYREFDRFREDYDPAIYRAWYVSTKPPRNVILNYELKEEIARGAFGQVYEALSASGERVAIKVLHQEIRNDRDMLQCFRRGVRSMEILSRRGIKGMAPYLEASEIPACVVMEHIDGPNLHQAVQAKQIENWRDILKVGVALTEIIRSAHGVPERVLHRDIKPANVMLRGFYLRPDWDIVVLDFDLSWHRDAVEVSMISASSASGYLAPEQLRRDPRVSTRNAAVDSFGLGMTLLYLSTGLEPMVGDHARADWTDRVRASVSARRCNTWRSLPSRIARLICSSTREQQHDRWDVSQVLGELQRLQEAESSPTKQQSAELLAEECMARTPLADHAQWDSDRLAATVRLPSGIEVSVRGDESAAMVETAVSWTSRGTGERRKIGKWIGRAFDQAEAALRRVGWKTVTKNVDLAGSGRLVVNLSTEQMSGRLDDAARGIEAARSKLALE